MTQTSLPPDAADAPMIRVVIVASYPAIRAGLHALLAGAGGFCVADEIPASGDLGARMASLRPDVVLLDSIGGESGSGDVSLATLLPLLSNRIALVVLGENPGDELPLLMGAELPGFGYLLRESDGAQIAQAIRAAHTGLVVLDRSVSVAIPGGIVEASRGTAYQKLPGETLTPRELEVLQLMAGGFPNKTIAFKLGISLHTAKFHVAQILGKLSATSRTEAVTLGARRGLILL